MPFIAALVALFAALLLGSYFAAKTVCDNRWQDRRHDFYVFGGCMVEYKGRLVPENRIWFERNQ